MRRITIRNLRSLKPVKPHLFDVIVDDNDIYFEIKCKNHENELVPLGDVLDQIEEPENPPPVRKKRRKK